ncbi:C40 family peptidase [Bacillus massiliigorillae]|uniref:C40 family peptidase n=1 Tax=Bacillus massiliigorillae TaxID=1243664 RepID=UPI00039C35DA|nr:C40 family peptidase [Bacillus massiliigorillae]
MRKMIIMTTLAFGILFSGIFGSIDASAASNTNYRVKAASTGQKFIGVPYKWGGTSPSGFDCSGFVGYAYKISGKVLPRTASEMYKRGTFVGRYQLQVGDTVFFSTVSKGASHVGIYIGNNQFVHAASNGVRIDSLNNSYWKPRYLGAKRI